MGVADFIRRMIESLDRNKFFRWWTRHPWAVFWSLLLIALFRPIQQEDLRRWIVPLAVWICLIYVSYVQGIRVTWRHSRATAVVGSFPLALLTPLMLLPRRQGPGVALAVSLLVLTGPVILEIGVHTLRRWLGTSPATSGIADIADAEDKHEPLAFLKAAAIVLVVMVVAGVFFIWQGAYRARRAAESTRDALLPGMTLDEIVAVARPRYWVSNVRSTDSSPDPHFGITVFGEYSMSLRGADFNAESLEEFLPILRQHGEELRGLRELSFTWKSSTTRSASFNITFDTDGRLRKVSPIIWIGG